LLSAATAAEAAAATTAETTAATLGLNVVRWHRR
jgi:hypothetical protein